MKIVDDEAKALVQVGFFRLIDLIMVGAGLFYAVTAAYWWVFTSPSAAKMTTVIFGLVLWANIWIILLLFRACRFIIEVRASMVNLPLDAARTLSEFFLKGNADPKPTK